LPQDERPASFCIGSREFDPVNVALSRKPTTRILARLA
jgi:hypothetical protein